MARACSVCAHPRRADVELALLGGASKSAIARSFALGRDAVRRHLAEHVGVGFGATRAALDRGRDVSLRERWEELYASAGAILAEAERTGRPAVGLAAIGQLRALLDLATRVAGEVVPDPEPIKVTLIWPAPPRELPKPAPGALRVVGDDD